MFSFDSNEYLCMTVQGRTLFKNNLMFLGNNVSDKCV